MTANELKSKAIHGASVNLIAQFVSFIFNTGSVIILSRLLSPNDFGLVAIVTAFSMWLMNFGENGFAEYIIQKDKINSNEINSIFWIHLAISIVLVLGFSLFSIFLVQFYSEPSLFKISVVMSLSFIIMALHTSQIAILKREMRFKAIAIIRLVAAILSILLAIAAALLKMAYWAIIVRQFSLLALTMIGAWIVCSWRPNFPNIFLSKNALIYGLKVYGNFTLTTAIRNIDKVLLGKFYGVADLGNYDRAYQLSMMPLNRLLSPLHSVALATLSKIKNDKNRFISYYTKSVNIIAFVGTGASLILTLSAEDIIVLLLGNDWRSAGKIVMAFGPGITAMFIYGTHSWLHLALGTPERWLKWNIFASIVIIIGFIVAAPYGAIAMAFAYSLTAFILMVPALWYGGKPIGLKMKNVFNSLWANFVSAIVVWLICTKLIFHYYQNMQIPVILKIILMSTFSAVLYVLIEALLKRNIQSIKELISISKIVIK